MSVDNIKKSDMINPMTLFKEKLKLTLLIERENDPRATMADALKIEMGPLMGTLTSVQMEMTQLLEQINPRAACQAYFKARHNQDMTDPLTLFYYDPEEFEAWILGPKDEPLPRLKSSAELAGVESQYLA